MKIFFRAAAFSLTVAFLAATSSSIWAMGGRLVEVTYEGSLDVPDGAKVIDLWAPMPPSDDYQEVVVIEDTLPEGAEISIEPVYGNRILHKRFTAPFAGKTVGLSVKYQVLRKEVRNESAKNLGPTKFVAPEGRLRRHLLGGGPVASDAMMRRIADNIGLDRQDPLRTSYQIYDYVLKHMDYGEDKPGWGRGDAAWAFLACSGNCTDFHSLFTSLARTQQIPAKFEMGLPLDPDSPAGSIEGYHCWAWFHAPEVGWAPVDISEADKHPDRISYFFGALTADRVAFSTGRNLVLVPPQRGAPLNFFIYPYFEVDGVAHDATSTAFSYRDMAE